MDWQVPAMWLAVGAVVIWRAARLLRKYVFRNKEGGGDNKPPCCRQE